MEKIDDYLVRNVKAKETKLMKAQKEHVVI